MTLFDITRILFALITVLGLIGLCSVMARKFGLLSDTMLATKQKRLQLVDSVGLDPKRRLAIIRCDEREHLVLLGPNGETVIDCNLPQISSSEIEQEEPSSNPNPFADKVATQIKKITNKSAANSIETTKAA